jgi:hypothetical protein
VFENVISKAKGPISKEGGHGMLWYVRSLLGLISGLCAILSPICVVHWLCRISPNESLQKLVSFMDPVFLPVSHKINALLPAVIYQWFGTEASVGQGVLSVLLTGMVILTAFLAKMVQVSETQNKLRHNRHIQQSIMRDTLARRTQQERKVSSANKLVVLLKHFDPDQLGVIMARAQQGQCEVLLQSDDKSIVLYNTIEQGLEAIRQSALWANQRMRQLRPMDTRPDYRFIAHAIDDLTHPQEAALFCQGLEVFCQSNNVLCTQSVSDVMRLKKLPGELISLGYYDLAQTDKNIELFKLHV